jgi:hypothetical protein
MQLMLLWALLGDDDIATVPGRVYCSAFGVYTFVEDSIPSMEYHMQIKLAPAIGALRVYHLLYALLHWTPVLLAKQSRVFFCRCAVKRTANFCLHWIYSNGSARHQLSRQESELNRFIFSRSKTCRNIDSQQAL